MDKKITNMFEYLGNCKGVKESVSFFLPLQVKGNIADAAFLYNNTPMKQKSRPSAKVLFDYSTGTLLVYENARVFDFIDTDAYPFSEQIDYSLPSDTTVSEQAKLLKRARELYSEVRKAAYQTELNAEEKQTVAEYQEILLKATPTELMPFYRALVPEYFAWVKQLD